MKVAMLSPIAWRTPPEHYGPWELVTSLLTDELVRNGIDVTLFATGNSKTIAKLHSVCEQGYEEDKSIDPKVWGCLHISECFEHANEFDLIHNNFDFLPLSYSGLVKTPVLTTIHGFSSPDILPVYKKYNNNTHYVSISDSDRSPELDYIATIYHGIDLDQFTFTGQPESEYLIFFGRIHHDKGAKEAIEIAESVNMKLIIAGIIQDENYYRQNIEPHIKAGKIEYIGSVGPHERDKVLGNALALLHPINFEEPFGMSVIEAMACGTPVITFNKGSMPELIQHGVNGFIVNNISEAIEHIHKLKNINRSDCRKTVQEKFSKEIMAKNYIKIYNQII